MGRERHRDLRGASGAAQLVLVADADSSARSRLDVRLLLQVPVHTTEAVPDHWHPDGWRCNDDVGEERAVASDLHGDKGMLASQIPTAAGALTWVKEDRTRPREERRVAQDLP